MIYLSRIRSPRSKFFYFKNQSILKTEAKQMIELLPLKWYPFNLNTVELQWLMHLWNHENMFQTGVVRASESLSQRQVRRQNRDTFLVFFNMKVYCVFSLESPHHGDSNEYTQYTIFNIRKKTTLNYLSQICSYGIFFPWDKNKVETAVVNEPSVFEPLKVYCTLLI